MPGHPGPRDQEEYAAPLVDWCEPGTAHRPVVYLYLVNYGRSRPEEVTGAISGFLTDCNDRNPLIRGLAIRTMSSIPLPPIIQALTDPLRHGLEDSDPYVRKTSALA
jgi:AP-2 complex subunit beta-1